MELKINKVAMMVDVSILTLNNWYKFKAEHPDNEYSKMLPEFERKDNRGTRYWKSEDIPKLIEFKNKVPHGRNGVLGSVTQRYVKKKEK